MTLAVVSPFLDKRHGTEGCVVRQVEMLARRYGCEIHLYCQQVEDVRAARRRGEGMIVWHKIPRLPGPHLLNYLWWFFSNHLWRMAARWRGNGCDLLYSPGVNCFDAEVMSVHALFSELREKLRPEMRLRGTRLPILPRLLHRRLYYAVASALERVVYGRGAAVLAPVSRKTARALEHLAGGNGAIRVIYHGIDLERFRPETRGRLRAGARDSLGIADAVFLLLLVGNGWLNKGLDSVLRALSGLPPDVHLAVVGEDDRAPYRAAIRKNGLQPRVRFLPPRPDIEFYYSAADACVAPSIEEAFGLPPAEAMACGLPVVVSSRAGASEIVTHGVDGLILNDPRDAGELAGLIRWLYEDPELRRRLGENAVRTASRYTWEKNVAALYEILEEALRRKRAK